MGKKTYPVVYRGLKQSWGKAVVARGFVFLSGVAARDPDTGQVKVMDIKGQTEIAWIKIKAFLEEAGTSLDNIVKILIILKNAKDFEAYHEATTKFLKKECPEFLENPPAMTLMEASLYWEEMLVEVDVTAVLPN